jgi:hypothetical protein
MFCGFDEFNSGAPTYPNWDDCQGGCSVKWCYILEILHHHNAGLVREANDITGRIAPSNDKPEGKR